MELPFLSDLSADLPAILRVLLVFVLILLAIRKKVSLGNAFLLGALFMGLVFGMGPRAIGTSAFHALIHPKTVSLAAIVSLILVLSHSMEKAGQMERLLSSFKGQVKNPRLRIAVFPALIGLLPMPGGAIFSAPMVKSIGEKHGLSGAELSYINYWFRHIWEYWWPLYPGVLLTTAMAGIDLWGFVIFLFPLTLVALVAGYVPLGKRRLEDANEPFDAQNGRREPLGPFLRELTPILMVIGIGMGLGFCISLATQGTGFTIAKETGLILALILAIGRVWRTNGFSGKDCRAVVLNRQLLELCYMVMAILIFQGMLNDSKAVMRVSREFIDWRIPLTLIVVLLPFLVGTVVGITIAFVATTFPILISLIQSLGMTHLMLPYMMLALASGFVGVLLSPLHLCLLLSNAYFRITLGRIYPYIWFPCLSLIAASSLYFTVASRFFFKP